MAAADTRARSSRRQLPITGSAHKTGVVRDVQVRTGLAAFDMAAERGRAALLDRRHDLELTQAHMPGIGAAPVGSMAIKDVCDLQPRAAHRRPATCRVAVSRRSRVRDGRGGWLRPGSWYWRHGCKCRGVEFGMAQRTRDIMRTFYVIEIRGSAERGSMLANGATASARDTRPGPPP